MAMQMGYLEKEQTKQKSSGLQELKAQRYSIEDKSRSVPHLHKCFKSGSVLCLPPGSGFIFCMQVGVYRSTGQNPVYQKKNY